MVEAVERLRWLAVVWGVGDLGRMVKKGSKGGSSSSRKSWAVGRLGNLVGTPVLNSIAASAKLMSPSARSTRNCLQAPGPLPMLRNLEVGKTAIGRWDRCMVMLVGVEVKELGGIGRVELG
jgi:hypothetical protein